MFPCAHFSIAFNGHGKRVVNEEKKLQEKKFQRRKNNVNIIHLCLLHSINIKWNVNNRLATRKWFFWLLLFSFSLRIFFFPCNHEIVGNLDHVVHNKIVIKKKKRKCESLGHEWMAENEKFIIVLSSLFSFSTFQFQLIFSSVSHRLDWMREKMKFQCLHLIKAHRNQLLSRLNIMKWFCLRAIWLRKKKKTTNFIELDRKSTRRNTQLDFITLTLVKLFFYFDENCTCRLWTNRST